MGHSTNAFSYISSHFLLIMARLARSLDYDRVLRWDFLGHGCCMHDNLRVLLLGYSLEAGKFQPVD
jgi:hypothetical protein